LERVPISKHLRTTAKELSFLTNTALASSKIHSLTVEEKMKEYRMRPSFHVIVRAPVGQVKSTIMEEIAGKVNREVITEITRAGLVGAIDQKTMQFIPGAAWECRNSLLLLDEFTFGRKKEGWEVFLQLLENQRWGKRIGLFSADSCDTDGDLYARVGKGRIDLKTRFACIVTTMRKLEYQRGQAFRAFVTRCVPYYFDLDESDLREIAEGASLYTYDPPEPRADVTIPRKTYSRLLSTADKELKRCDRSDIRKELYMRSVGDLCRAYAVWDRNDISTMRDIVKWKVEAQSAIGSMYR